MTDNKSILHTDKNFVGLCHYEEFENLQIFLYSKPVQEKNGDYSLYFQKGNTYYYALLDATGHGPQAASINELIIEQLDRVQSIDDPGKFLTLISNIVYKNKQSRVLRDDQFMVGSIVGIDTKNNIMNFCSAGNIYAGIYNHNMKRFQHFPTKKHIHLLGFEENQEFIVSKSYFTLGNTIIFFSDGFGEAVNSEKQFFIQNNFQKLEPIFVAHNESPLDTIGLKFEELFLRFSRDISIKDDLSYALIRRFQ